MTKLDLLRKITSRKFLGTLFTQIVALIIAIRTGQGLPETIAGLTVLCIVTVVYVHTEGKVDASRTAVELIEMEPQVTEAPVDEEPEVE